MTVVVTRPLPVGLWSVGTKTILPFFLIRLRDFLDPFPLGD